MMQLVPVIVFVDWNNQVHETKTHRRDNPTVEAVLTHIAKRLRGELSEFLADHRFTISLRLYCGWHKGFEPTEWRRRLSSVLEGDLFNLSTHPNMMIRSMSFSDLSLGALERRISKGTNSHFPGTCRARGRGWGDLEEKMVDTALVSDLICSSVDGAEDSWLIVLGEDVDLMPGVYMAERFLSGGKRRVAFLRKSKDPYLVCTDLQVLRRELL